MEKILNQIYCILRDWFTPRKVSYEIKFVNKSSASSGEYGDGGISFKNIGDVPVTINSFPLDPGDPMISFPIDKGEIDMTKYKIIFENPTVGINPSVALIRKNRG